MMEHRGTKSGLGVIKCWRIFFFFPCLMTFFVLLAFYRNQQFLDDNPTDFYGDKFTSPEELKFPNSTDQLVVIAVIVKGLSADTNAGAKLKHSFKYFVKSLVIKTKSKPVRLIFLSDGGSIEAIEIIWQEALPPFPLFNQIKTESGNVTQVPRFDWVYVDVDKVTEKVGPWSEPMKVYFNHKGAKHTLVDDNKNYLISFPTKYDDTIYYLFPFYHKIFVNLDTLIVVDADVRFRSDPAEIFGQFEKFSDKNLLGIGNDLAPHYHTVLSNSQYLQAHPDSVLGQPGRFQGLNVGVVLYKLDRIRSSLSYKYYLSQNGTDYLAQKYGFTSTHLGAQDWVTLVLFEEPDLIFPLNCKFNFQMSQEYDVGPFKKIFKSYHNCQETPAIVHGNGDSMIYEY